MHSLGQSPITQQEIISRKILVHLDYHVASMLILINHQIVTYTNVPPQGIHNTVIEVEKHWVHEGNDEILKVNSPGHTRRKAWMTEKCMQLNFNKRKQTLNVADARVA